MVNLANLLELVAGGEPLEVIDIDNTTVCINPKKGELFLHPFSEYEVLNVYSGVDCHRESYIVIEVRRMNYVKSK